MKQFDSVKIIQFYFPSLSIDQIHQFEILKDLYLDWNSKINVVSRKDIDFLEEKHIIHSLGIAKFHSFKEGIEVLDVGTGGGFPGVPLAIFFPEVQFVLVDSIGKKIKVVDEVVAGLGLENVKTTNGRVEEVKDTYDFIVSRAVAQMETFVGWTKGRISKKQNHDLKNGILYLKGGDLSEELKLYTSATIYDLPAYFEEDFYETKKVVHLGMKFKG